MLLQEPVLLKLIHITTKYVQFSFNNAIYQQIYRISMGSSLGAALANIFVVFPEAKRFQIIMSLFNEEYIDDTSVIFSFNSESRRFFYTIKQWDPMLTFTCEFERNNSLPLLDVFLERTTFGALTSIYRKPTFTESFTRWGSFCPLRRKINLIKTFVHRWSAPRQNFLINSILSRRIYWRMDISRIWLLPRSSINACSSLPSQSLDQRDVLYI